MKIFILIIILVLILTASIWFWFYKASNPKMESTQNQPSQTWENKQSENHDFLFEEWCKENPKECKG